MDGDEVLDAEEEKEWERLYYNWTHAAEQVESACCLVGYHGLVFSDLFESSIFRWLSSIWNLSICILC